MSTIVSWKIKFEFLICFIFLPVLYGLDLIPIHKSIPILVLFIYCLFVLFKHKQFDKSKFSWKAKWSMILLRFFLLGTVMLVFTYFYSDQQLGADLENKKLLIMTLMYPIFSAFPQEVIYRQFFYYRYGELFKNPAVLLSVNVFVFAFAHIYFAHWVVIAFTVIGGVIFSHTYKQSRSLIVTSVEHSLYGLIVLLSSLSQYFYKGF